MVCSDQPNTLGRPASISVVVPVYNSEQTLSDLVTRIDESLTMVAECFELIMVNDGSHDRSWDVICELSVQHSWIKGINLMRNYGQHNALLAGIRQARGEIIVTMDDDLQNPPEEIPRLLEKLAEGYDVVYGVPQCEQHGLWRDKASQITKLALQGAMGAETARHVSAFRVFRAQVREAFVDYSGPFVSIDVLLTWGTARFTSVLVRHDVRQVGVSNYTFRKLVVHALNMMTGFSVLPLQIASWMGFAFTAFGMLVLLYVIGRFILEGGSVPGFPFLASIVALFSGAQLFALGIFGEYLARMYFRTMERPAYVVRESVQGMQE
ncbi:MAG: glycosyltransferase family 2 protein [Anaerolineae bacterium]|nr:glycosyltransferase family 2 protein [Anaerolineae bacterium]